MCVSPVTRCRFLTSLLFRRCFFGFGFFVFVFWVTGLDDRREGIGSCHESCSILFGVYERYGQAVVPRICRQHSLQCSRITSNDQTMKPMMMVHAVITILATVVCLASFQVTSAKVSRYSDTTRSSSSDTWIRGVNLGGWLVAERFITVSCCFILTDGAAIRLIIQDLSLILQRLLAVLVCIDVMSS